MVKVAKCLVIDSDANCLVLYLNNHPTFGNDIDLPGGTMDRNESLVQTMIREAYEEAGLLIPETKAKLIFEGAEYSRHGTFYALYAYRVNERPLIKLSWEHGSFEWIPKAMLIEKGLAATDTFMHMAANMVNLGKV